MTCGYRHVCIECFADEGLRDFVEGHAVSGTCSFCGSTSENLSAASINRVTDHIQECIYRDYDEAVNVLSYVSAEGGYQGTHWDTYDLLHDVIGIDLPNDTSGELLNALVDGLGFTDWCHRDPYGPRYHDHVRFSWDHFCNITKHQRRFFFSDYEVLLNRDETLSPSQTLETIFEYAENDNLFVQIPQNTHLFRARFQRPGETLRTAQQLGPPTEDRASQSNRMSPPGIVMFYASEISETAIRETVSEPGTFVVGEFITRRNATILDFGSLSSIPGLFESISDALEYDPRNVSMFLHHIVNEISQPIERGDRVHVEYVPTQVVTEYIRSNARYNNARIDGIRFPSAVHVDHFSFVIFSTQDNILPIEEATILDREDRWIELINTSIHDISQTDIDGWNEAM